MKRFAIALAIVLMLGFGSTALAGGHGHGHGDRDHYGRHDVYRHYAHRPPVVRIYSPPVVRVYSPPVQVYYPPVQPYGCGYHGYYRSPEAEMAIGIGRIVGAAIEMGR